MSKKSEFIRGKPTRKKITVIMGILNFVITGYHRSRRLLVEYTSFRTPYAL